MSDNKNKINFYYSEENLFHSNPHKINKHSYLNDTIEEWGQHKYVVINFVKLTFKKK